MDLSESNQQANYQALMIEEEPTPLVQRDSNKNQENTNTVEMSKKNCEFQDWSDPSNEGDLENSYGQSSSLDASITRRKKGSISRPWLTANYQSMSSPQMISQDHHSKAALLLSCTSPTSPNPSATSPSWLFSSDKRNAEFHEYFPEVSNSQRLIEEYSCAVQKDILWHGRLYITEDALYFYSKILWVYKIEIPIEKIWTLEKKLDPVSGIFPNSLLLVTEKERILFASFMNRDAVVDLIQNLRLRHGSIPMQTMDNSLTKEESQDVLKKLQNKSTDSLASTSSYKVSYKGKKKRAKSFDELKASIESIKRAISNEKKAARSRSVSPPGRPNWESLSTASMSVTPMLCKEEYATFQETPTITLLNDLVTTNISEDVSEDVLKGKELNKEIIRESTTKQIQSPIVISPTNKEPESCTKDITIKETQDKPKGKEKDECKCKSQHAQMKNMLDHNFQVSIDSLWTTLFGSALHESDFCRLFWEKKLKYKNILFSKWQRNQESNQVVLDSSSPIDTQEIPLSQVENGWQRNLEYTVPSSNPIGPREIKTIVCNKILFKDFNNQFVCIEQVTTTPHVTAGDCFEIILRTCIRSIDANNCNLKVSCSVRFLKSTWIKLIIEKAGTDSLLDYFGLLKKELESHIANSVESLPNVDQDSMKESTTMLAESSTRDYIHHPLENELNALLKSEELARKVTTTAPSPLTMHGWILENSQYLLLILFISTTLLTILNLISLFYIRTLLQQVKDACKV